MTRDRRSTITRDARRSSARRRSDERQRPQATGRQRAAEDTAHREPRGNRRPAARRRREDSTAIRPQPQGDGARVDALDGLRALAIACVVLYHLKVPWLPSGHMGVVMFLVLTGFLVTTSAGRALARDGGRIGLASVWRRRLRRIWPPMAAMVVVVTALCVLINHILLTKMRPDIVPSLLLYPNISYIVRGSSYFDQIGGPSPLTHLWYLGVDAQFCLAWPLVLAALGSSGARDGKPARIVALVLACVSAILMAVLYNPDTDPTRVYYGPDTRAFAPLLGAWLALAWPLHEEAHAEGPTARLLADGGTLQVAGIVSLGALAAIMALLPATSPLLYRGGMALVAVLVTVLLAALRTGGPLGRAFGSAPARWLARRSYALYLWHYPLFALCGVLSGTAAWWRVALAVTASLAAAELTVRAGNALAAPGGTKRAASPAVLLPATVTLLVAGIGLIVVPQVVAVPEEAVVSTGVSAGEAMDLSTTTSGDGAADAHDTGTADDAASTTDDATATTHQDLNNLPSGSIVLTESAEAKAAGIYDPVVIGDSVPGDVADYFYAHCPDGLLDSYVGRRSDQMEAVLNGYLNQGIVGHVVILEAFGNNVASDDEIARMITACGPERSVYLVNVRTTDGDQNLMNAPIDRAVERFGNATLIDWLTHSADHLDLLYADGTHLRPEAGSLYWDLITNAIKRSFVEGGGTVSAATAE